MVGPKKRSDWGATMILVCAMAAVGVIMDPVAGVIIGSVSNIRLHNILERDFCLQGWMP